MIKSFVNYFLKNSVIVNWIMLVICIGGIFALFNLNKRLDPKFEIENIEVDVPYPGASAIEVEEGIVNTIDWYLANDQWLANIVSGDYEKYYESMYEGR